ncbi:hypothetical protein KIPB_004881, partial [Kipferlia bialata]
TATFSSLKWGLSEKCRATARDGCVTYLCVTLKDPEEFSGDETDEMKEEVLRELNYRSKQELDDAQCRCPESERVEFVPDEEISDDYWTCHGRLQIGESLLYHYLRRVLVCTGLKLGELKPHKGCKIRDVTSSPGSVVGRVQFTRFRENQYWMHIHVKPVPTKMSQPVPQVIIHAIAEMCPEGSIATNEDRGGILHTKTTQPLDVPGMGGQLSVTVEAGGRPRGRVPRECGFHFEVTYHSQCDSGVSTDEESASDEVYVYYDPSPSLVVAKGTMALHNSKMCRAGPTIDKIEVAKEWQGKGIGSALLRYMELTGARAMPLDLDVQVDYESLGVRMQVTDIQTEKAINWFVSKGYGPRGEEMSKGIRVIFHENFPPTSDLPCQAETWTLE